MDPLKKTLGDLEKLGIIMKPFGELGKEKQNLQSISTGSLSLNKAIGCGGWPRGRLIEMYGRESSGKSTMCLITIANVQKNGGTVAYIDSENGFDPTWAKRMGVDVDSLLYNVPETGEQGFEILMKLVESNSVDFIVVDSLAALVPRQEIENPMEKETIGLQARLVSRGLRKLNQLLSKSKSVVIFINQLREKVGVMYGNPETTPGGLAMKFYASIRLQVSRVKDTTEKDEKGNAMGHKVKVKVVKNKVGEPFKEAEFLIHYSSGIDNTSELLDVALAEGIITLEGKTYSYGTHSWVGYEKCYNGILSDGTLQADLLARMGGQGQAPEATTEEVVEEGKKTSKKTK